MKYIIKIPKPCNEDWSTMSTTERGMYCSNCKKEVLDFKNISNRDLIDYLEKNDSVCGRFSPSQINHPLFVSKTKAISKLKLFFAVSPLLMSSQIFSQSKPKIEAIEKKVSQSESIESTNPFIEISGQIVEQEMPLPGINVNQKGTDNFVQSNFDGKFLIKIPIEDFKNHVYLVFTSPGMKTSTVQVFDKSENSLKIEMADDGMLMGEVAFTSKKKNIFKRIGNLFSK